jgi:hypothetical protein
MGCAARRDDSMLGRMLIESRAPIWFLLARRQRLAYLQVPKAACSAMRAALCLLNRPDLSREAICAHGALVQHPEWADRVRADDPVVHDFFRFTFVREPYARFASFYRSKISRPFEGAIRPRFAKLGFRAGMSIDKVLDLVEATPVADLDQHLAPQSSIVFAGEKPRVRFIGRIEQLKAGLDEIAAQSGTRIDVPRVNVTAGTPDRDDREPLSAAARTRLARLYAEDFARFGYSP